MGNGHGLGDATASDTAPAPIRGPAGLIVRDPGNGVISGVCAGIAERTGLDPLLVRMVAVLAGLSAGLGIACYITLWLTTPTVHNPGKLPLPGIRGTGWFGFAVLLLVTCAGAVLVVRALVPLTWWPAALIALAIVVMRLARPAIDAHERRRRAAAAHPAPARSTRPVTIITWITLPAAAAAGAAMFLLVDARPLARVVCGVAAALGTIGAGLVLTSLWGISRLLRDVGAVLGVIILILDTPFITTLGLQTRSSGYDADQGWGSSDAVVVKDQNTILDLGSLPAQGSEVTVEVHDSSVHVIAPGNRTVTIEYSCFFSELTLPSGGGCASIGSGVWTNGITTGPGRTGGTEARSSAPLHVTVRLVRSQMEVTR
ncbi:PspC domain-containing protein [Propionibacterium australiense]|nr:PspC domain-containing protein [Propionibacterium australiense]SYZ32766.1 Phage shock protein, PspC, N-terminal [Propionibacterium australiense]VEH91294.1 phage shock protein C [Propionibacterium australiense]